MQCNDLVALILAIFILHISNINAIIPTSNPDAIDQNDISRNLSEDTLIFANVIYRHGDRNIETIYPNDPYRDEVNWPGGYGQLTNAGKRRQFKLGQFFRRRYNKLIGNKYSPYEVYTRSTDVDRALMSALANLAGLFMPSDEEIWNENILWQPIPVHTIPKELDHVLGGLLDCPKYKAAREAYFNESTEVRRFFTEYADQIEYWSKMSGLNITTTHDVLYLFKTIKIEYRHNKILPEWAQKAIIPNSIMEYIAAFHYRSFSGTKQLARLKNGYLLKEMLEHFSMKINSTLKPDRSLWLYSAHDVTVISILNIFGVYEIHLPSYASSVHIELYRNDKNEHYVQLFYRNFEEEILAPISIPYCGKKCPLNRMYELYSELIPGDYHSECF